MVSVAFEYVQGDKSDSGWQAVIPLMELMGIDDGAVACLMLKEGHLINLPNGDAYKVAKVIWRPWGMGSSRDTRTPGWMLAPHLLVILHRVGSDLSVRLLENVEATFLEALAGGRM